MLLERTNLVDRLGHVNSQATIIVAHLTNEKVTELGIVTLVIY